MTEVKFYPVPQFLFPDAVAANIADPDRFRILKGAVEYMPKNKETLVEKNVFSTDGPQ